jgi:hypothetical protein
MASKPFRPVIRQPTQFLTLAIFCSYAKGVLMDNFAAGGFAIGIYTNVLKMTHSGKKQMVISGFQ